MPPRPVLKPKQNRPSSAIYLGSQADLVHSPVSIANTSTPPSLPSLPEPPSPSTSIGSTGSGLPSPPATNSTGSGSTGDPASISRKHNISIISLNSSTSSSGSGYNVFGSAGSDNTINAVPRGGTIGSAAKAAHRSSMGALVVGGGGGRASRSSSRMGDDTDDDGLFDDPNDKSFHDNDEDNTARVAHDHRRQSQQPLNKSSSENIIALERVKSLTQRNRLVLDKLTSIRLNSPSPHPNARSSTPLLSTSRSTLPPSSSQASASASATSATSATSSHASLSSSSRLSQSSQPQTRQSVRAPPIDRQLSGSETEREGEGSVVYSQYTHTSSASSSSSSHVHIYSLNDGITNPAGNGGRSTPPSAYTSQFQKMRLSSAPATPNKSRLASSSSNHSASSSSPSSSSASRRRKRASMLASMSTSSLVEYVGPDPGPGRGDDRELGQEHVPATTDDEEDYYYDRQSTVSGATSGGDSRDRNRDRDRDRDKDKDRGRDNTLVRRLSRTGSNEIDKSREITEAALAAVASSRRRSPVDTRKPRGALPREFRDPANTSVASLASANAGGGNERSTGRSSLDGSNSGRSGHSNEPQTPHRRERRLQQHAQSILYSPSAKQQRTRSTVRDRDRDRERDAYSRAASRLGYDDDESYRDEEGFGGGEQEPPPRRESHREKRERRQGVRAGSAESALALGLPAAATAGGGAGRSLVGEGLRAAGLKRRDAAAGHTSSRSIRLNGDDVFRSEDEARDVGKERERERKGDWSRAGTVSARARAATSMGEYRYIDSGRGVEDDEEDGLRSAPLKSKKSAYRLASIARDRSPMQVGDREKEREVDRSVSVLGMRRDRDRYSSPSGPRRPAPLASTTRGGAAPAAPATTTPTSASALLQQQQQQSLEHARLMMDSLVMFESHVTKLAGLNPSAQADLVRTAQSVALSVEKLNGLMRNGNVRALEEQIDAEVNSSGGEGAMDSAEMWRKVGSDYREGLRCSDDLIRGVTSLLLGVGKILRDHTGGGGGAAGSGGSDAGSHGRSVSLDEEFGVVVRRTPDGVVGGSLNDRENRRSWDLNSRFALAYASSTDDSSDSWYSATSEDTSGPRTTPRTGL
ncbi:hypothetical protein AX16_003472 [Volvariella volvacea WC 439]|nr:hypothetical protein AX16_003472 [Volvariella volvacea WC 439]